MTFNLYIESYTVYSEDFDFHVYPSQWNLAIVCPISKTNNPAELKDLRPISI